MIDLQPLERMTINTHELHDRIDSKLRELAQARQEYSWASTAEVTAMNVLSRCGEMIEHCTKLEQMWQLQDRIEMLTNEITLLAERLDLAGGDSHRKVSLSRERRPRYTNADALQWLIKNHPEYLSFNRQEFERLARAQQLDFVKFEDVPAVSIDNDLFEYLPEEIKDPLKSAVIVR